MSLWTWIGQAAETGADALSALLAKTGALFGAIPDAATRREVAFATALIALSAKMAKADGVVTQSEVAAFRRIFHMPASEEGHVARLFDLAKRDVAGYDSYARRVAALYADARDALVDVLDGLFFIAKADGAVHEAELAFLETVAEIFGIRGAAFEQIAARHVVGPEGDPFAVLGVNRDWPYSEIRSHYLKLVAENHPDRFIARGLPPDFIAIANDRLAAINRAYEQIERQRRPAPAEAG
ncbi:MAG TPA: TerB family tellurite resistance protein [Bauldia sp.]|nr:TerB family tellurite resistance protein [Bauldia sp.]